MNWQDIFDRLPYLGMLKAWLPYVGALTGLAGMIAGVGAFIRSGRSRALDLRLELRKEENATRALLEELPALIDHANSSRTSINIATGRFDSRDQQLWNLACENDRAELAGLRAQLPEPGIDYRRMLPEELEAALVAVDELRVKASCLRDKYNAAMSADDKMRDRIQARHHASVQAVKA
jgi:hypothetical protein